MSDTKILSNVFKSEPCDFCPIAGPVYIDPETQCRYCLDCLAFAIQADAEMAVYDSMPPDPTAGEVFDKIMATRQTI